MLPSKGRAILKRAYAFVKKRLGLLPPPPQAPAEPYIPPPTWEGLLELKRLSSGPDGLTADLVRIGELQKYYNELPEKVREEHKKDFAEMMAKGCNWSYAVPQLERITGFPHGASRPLYKESFLLDCMQEKIALLKNNLDDESCNVIDTFIYRTVQLPEFFGEYHHDVNIFGFSDQLRNFLRGNREAQASERYTAELPQYRSQYNFENFSSYFEPSVFLFHHGLRSRKNEVGEYIKQRDFIDGGSWIGDSALVLIKNYAPKKIHCFDISPQVCAQFVDVMEANSISPDHYTIINAGLDEKSGQLHFTDNGSTGGNLLENLGDEECKVITIDEYVTKNQLDIGFIKLDLEGLRLRAIRGASATIREQLPVLSIAIYHNSEEFFLIKPFLEDLTNKYAFFIERHHIDYTGTWETFLMAIPKVLVRAPGASQEATPRRYKHAAP